MSITVEVGLLSGRTVTLEASVADSLGDLKQRAQSELGVGRGRLLNSSGCLLEGFASLEEAGLENGDSLTLQSSTVQICSSWSAFAAILGDGSVTTYDHSGIVVDPCSMAVQDQLRNVQQIQATEDALPPSLVTNLS